VFDVSNGIYEIQAIKYVVSTFNVDKMRMGDKRICEISLDGTVKRYRIEHDTKKHINTKVKKVDQGWVEQFFKELRQLLTAADREYITIDDTSRKLTVMYSSSHKEIFEESVSAGNRSVDGLIGDFLTMVDSERANNKKSSVTIVKQGITEFTTDIIVNAANQALAHGGGVCGYIFDAAGARELTKACMEIGHCDTGSAVITPAFRLKAKYIVHAVGPRYNDGKHGEADLLYGAYYKSLTLAKENKCHSIAFPLISAGIFGYPLNEAWDIALKAAYTFILENKDYKLDIYFAILDDRILQVGRKKQAEYER
jgi:O-acetyl-ADP-ribose deacetylase (regulator of RNase III)